MQSVVYLGPSASVDIVDPDVDAVYVAERDKPVDVPDALAERLCEQDSFIKADARKTQRVEKTAADAEKDEV